MYVNFQYQPQPQYAQSQQLNTYAHGDVENGGNNGPIASTLALYEEGGGGGPIATTQALNEEGGGGPIATTLALGEEGGGPGIIAPPNDPPQQTIDVFNVFRQADRQGGQFGFGRRSFGDGNLTRPELGNFINRSQNQLNFLNFFNNYFPTFNLQPIIQNVENRLETGNFLNNHYDTFAGADGNNTNLTQFDVFNLASRDGRFQDISFNDLGIVF